MACHLFSLFQNTNFKKGLFGNVKIKYFTSQAHITPASAPQTAATFVLSAEVFIQPSLVVVGTSTAPVR